MKIEGYLHIIDYMGVETVTVDGQELSDVLTDYNGSYVILNIVKT